MNTSDMNENHKLTIEEVNGYERVAGYRYYGECSCHNPDGNGYGRQDYLGITREHIELSHFEHVQRLAIVKEGNND